MDLTKPTTHAEFASLIGVSRQAVTGMVREGLLSAGATASDWLNAYCGRLREQAAGRQGTPQGLNLSDERAHLAKVQREQIELKIAKERRELVSLEEVNRALGPSLGRCRDRLLQIADRTAPVLAATSDERLCRSIVDGEVRDALNEIVERMQ